MENEVSRIFLNTLALWGAVGIVFVLGFMILVGFFQTLSWLRQRMTASMRRLREEGMLATVEMNDRTKYERVRFRDGDFSDGLISNGLKQMVCLEDEVGNQTLVRLRDIRRVLIAKGSKENV